jgi:hypothetical protein
MRRSRRPGPFNPNLDRRGACSPFPRLLHPGSKPRNVAMELEDRAPTLPAPDPSDPFARSHPLRDPWPINNTPCLSRRFVPRDSLLCIQCATLDVTAVFSVGPGNRPRIARPLRKRDTDLLTFASGSRLALSRARNAIAMHHRRLDFLILDFVLLSKGGGREGGDGGVPGGPIKTALSDKAVIRGSPKPSSRL